MPNLKASTTSQIEALISKCDSNKISIEIPNQQQNLIETNTLI